MERRVADGGGDLTCQRKSEGVVAAAVAEDGHVIHSARIEQFFTA